MPRTVIVVAAVILAVHGLIHLIGLTVYLRLGDIEGFAYKTTVLGGRVDLGTNGTRVFGALWVIPAIAFVGAAVALYASWTWCQPVLFLAASISHRRSRLPFDAIVVCAASTPACDALMRLHQCRMTP